MRRPLTILALALFMHVYLACSSQEIVIASEPARLYHWKDNNLRIALEGTDCDDIVVKVSEGKIEKTGDCAYVFSCDNTSSHTIVYAGVRIGKNVRWADSSRIQIYSLPDPLPRISMHQSGDTVGLSQWHMMFHGDEPTDTARVCPDLWCKATSGAWEIHESSYEKIVEFSVKVLRGDSVILSETNTGAVFSKNVCAFLHSALQKGDKVIFDHIVCEMYKKERRKLKDPLVFYMR